MTPARLISDAQFVAAHLLWRLDHLIPSEEEVATARHPEDQGWLAQWRQGCLESRDRLAARATPAPFDLELIAITLSDDVHCTVPPTQGLPHQVWEEAQRLACS